MDSLKVQMLPKYKTEILDLSARVYWFVVVDERCCDEIYKIISQANDQDFECEIFGLLLSKSEEVVTWLQNQGIKLNFALLLDPNTSEQLGISTVPWYICIENSQILYSGQELPDRLEIIQNLEKSLNGNSEYLQNLDSIQSPPKAKKLSSLERALQRIDKLRENIREKDKIIEECRAEIKQLRSILIETQKKNDVKETPETKTVKKIRNNYDSVQKKSFSHVGQYKETQKFDEKEFWNIQEDDDKQSIDFEEIAAGKSLWLMGLFNAQKKEKKAEKISKVLPPLQFERQRNARSIVRDYTNQVKRTQKKVF